MLQSENRKSSPRLSANSLVMAEAALPHKPRPHPREQQPAGLDRQPLCKFNPFKSAEKDGDRKKQLVIERQPSHHGVDCGGHNVDRKHLATEEKFERIYDENDGGDFQNPERKHRQTVGDEELNERGHHSRDDR